MILYSWGLKASRKSAGGLTTLNYKGQTIAKQKRAKGQSNPSPQYLQSQAAAKLIVGIFQKIKTVILEGYTNIPKRRSATNEFFSYTYKNALDLSAPPAATLEPGNLLVTKGIMAITDYTAAPVADSGAQTVLLSLAGGIGGEHQALGQAAAGVLYNQSNGQWMYIADIANRQLFDFGLTIDTPNGFMSTGDTIWCYCGFFGQQGTPTFGYTSNSVAASTIAL